MAWRKGEAIWKQIEIALLEDLTSGVFKPGEKLPTENDLAKRFKVNRHTLRSAISALAEANIVRVEQGRGIFVQEKVLPYPIGKRPRFSQTVTGAFQLPDRQLLNGKSIASTKKVARELGLQIGAPVWRLESISMADGFPLSHSVNYLDHKRFPDINDVYKETKSFTKTYAHYGIYDYTRKYTKIVSLLPNATIANHLKQHKSKPVLQTEGLDVTEDGRPLEYGITSFASERVQLVLDS